MTTSERMTWDEMVVKVKAAFLELEQIRLELRQVNRENAELRARVSALEGIIASKTPTGLAVFGLGY